MLHLYVAQGEVALEGAAQRATRPRCDHGPSHRTRPAIGGPALHEGDAARIEDAQGQRVTAGPAGAEILVWEMHAKLR